MAVENVNVSQSNTGFSANPVELVQEAVKQKQAVKRAVNDVLDDTFEKVTEAATAPVEKTLLNSVAPLRRIVSLPDMVSQGDVAAAIGLGGLTLVSLPEDCRDLRDAYRHSKSVLTRSRFSNAYNYRKYQHDFSFFRGTLLHELMKRAKSPKMKKFVNTKKLKKLLILNNYYIFLNKKRTFKYSLVRLYWCRRRDSNPHGFPHDFESCASAIPPLRQANMLIIFVSTNQY